MNRLPNKMIAVAACLGLASICAPAQATTYTFSQTGFADGGAVSGYFTGRDLNADGVISTLRGHSEISDFGLRYTGGSQLPDLSMDFNDLLFSQGFGLGLEYVIGSATIGAGVGLDDGLMYMFDMGTTPLPAAAVLVLPGTPAGRVISVTANYTSVTLDFMNVQQVPANGQQVPEPASLGLVMGGVALLAARRRTRG